VSLPVFMTLGWLGHLLTYLFFAAIWLGVARVLFPMRHRPSQSTGRSTPCRAAPAGGSAVANRADPAHNEAKVIVGAVKPHPGERLSDLEVIVVDDGSTDGTSDRMREALQRRSRVKLITIPNGGKSRRPQSRLAGGARGSSNQRTSLVMASF